MNKKKNNKGLGKKIVFLVLIPIMIMVGILAGSYVVGADVGEVFIKEKEIEEETVALDEFTLNLEPIGNKRRYIRLELVLSTKKRKGIDKIKENESIIRDYIIQEVSHKKEGDIFESEGEGFLIKDKIKEGINKKIGENVVHQVYVVNVLVQ